MRKVTGVGYAMLVLSFVLVSADQAVGQGQLAAEVRGTVVDQSGAIVPGVRVTITNVLTGVQQQVTTNVDGIYDAPSVPPGEYSISFEKTGFSRFERTGITLELQTVTLNATLRIGASSQTINVVGKIPLVQTETPEQSTTLTSTAVTETPNVGRTWYDMLEVLPGVNGADSLVEGGEAVGVNGQGSQQENWMIDGGDATLTENQNSLRGGVPLDAIQEVKLDSANFGAEYGNGLSMFNVITKSGTNAWHGDLFEYVQNDALEARNYFAPSKLPLRWNEYGGSLGGPLRRDKAFFFFCYQRNPQTTQVPGFASFPTAAMRAGDFSNPQLQTIYDPATLQQVNGNWVRQPFPSNIIPSGSVNPVAEAVLQYIPMPNMPGLANNFYYPATTPYHEQWVDAKVDYNVTPSNHLTGSLRDYTGGWTWPTAIVPLDSSGLVFKEWQGQLTDVWTISPTVVAQFRFSGVDFHLLGTNWSYDRGYPSKLGLINPASNIFPIISIEGTVSSEMQADSYPPAIDREFEYSPAATLTVVRGKHILKLGGEFDRLWYNGGWPLEEEGDFDFNGIFTRNPSNPSSAGEGLADFLLGLPDTWSVSIIPETGERAWTGQLFAQDEYKIRKDLTLTYGVRWISQSGWSEVHNRMADFDPTLPNPGWPKPGALMYAGQDGMRRAAEDTVWDVFEPRIGFAWAPRSNWSVRGGYGIYNVPWGAYAYGGNPGLGWGVTGYETSSDLIHPIFNLSEGPPPPTILTSAVRTPGMLNGQPITYYPANTPVGYAEEYRLDVQHQVRGGVLIDGAYVGNRGVHLPFNRDMNQVPQSLLGPGNAQLSRPWPQYTGISAYLDHDISNYNALQISVRRDFANGLQAIASYAYAKAMDTMTVNAWFSAPTVWQNANNLRGEYGPSNTDMRNELSGEIVYELPLGNGKRFINGGDRLVNALVGGWQVATVFQVHSGMPFTPLMGTANLSGSLAGAWRPNRIASGTLSNPTLGEWFNTSAFVQPVPYTFGNSGRNFLYGPAWKEVNLRLAKEFKLSERFGLKFDAEAFDAFNAANFGMPNANIGSATAGIISSANTNRSVQLGVKLQF